ncbi:MAG TPA: protein kinase [Streptosporangiaceae bacterium]|nr:protein kinase [Streptosporangiaceae bacterium]
MRVQDRAPERLGPYRVIRRLGQGGMGVVYLATDEAGQQVAVKALHPGMAQEENARRRLAREVETMHRVRSQYVAQVLGADLDGDPPYIVTRYVPGLTLDAVISAGGPMTGQALARLAYGLAQALAAVHAAGVVHRDLKPGNVMISDGEPVVIDFGIAQLAETTRLTLTGMFMGTPGYLAPEVIEGKDSGPGSDVHSWGATLAFAATGRPPFGTGTFEAIFYRIMHSLPDLDTLPAPLRPMVLHALSRDPVYRPSSAELVEWAASLDPETLIPSPPAAAGAIVTGLPGSPTVTDQAFPAAWPASTRPMPNDAPADVRDLLPPVNYAVLAGNPGAATADAPAGPYGAGQFGSQGRPAALQAGAGGAAVAGGQPAGAGQLPPNGHQPGGQLVPAGQYPLAGPYPAGPYPERRSAGAVRSIAAISPWSPLVIASVGIVAAVSIMAPLVGTVAGLALFVALRALATTGRQLARRGQSDGMGVSMSFAALVLFPVSVLRALIGLVLLAPLALLGSCMVVAATIIAVPVHPLPQALAFGAGTLMIIVGLGPGSSGSRAILASLYSSLAKTPGRLAVAYFGVLSICTWAGLTAWYQSPAAAYWPVIGLHAQLEHLPTLRHVLTDVRHNLLRLAHQFGL